MQKFTENLIASLTERFAEAPVWRALENLTRPDAWRQPDLPLDSLRPLAAHFKVSDQAVEEEWLDLRSAVAGRMEGAAVLDASPVTFRMEVLLPALASKPAGGEEK